MKYYTYLKQKSSDNHTLVSSHFPLHVTDHASHLERGRPEDAHDSAPNNTPVIVQRSLNKDIRKVNTNEWEWEKDERVRGEMIQWWESDVRYSWRNRLLSLWRETDDDKDFSPLSKYLKECVCRVVRFVCGCRYTSGDVRLWDTLHWDLTSSYLKANGLSANTTPRPHVAHVQVSSTVAAAAYEDGECVCRCVDPLGVSVEGFMVTARIWNYKLLYLQATKSVQTEPSFLFFNCIYFRFEHFSGYFFIIIIFTIIIIDLKSNFVSSPFWDTYYYNYYFEFWILIIIINVMYRAVFRVLIIISMIIIVII